MEKNYTKLLNTLGELPANSGIESVISFYENNFPLELKIPNSVSSWASLIQERLNSLCSRSGKVGMTQRLGEYKIERQGLDHELWETHSDLFFSEINSFDGWNEKRKIEIQANPSLRFNLNMKGIFLTASTDRHVYRKWLRYGHVKRPRITTSELEIQKLKNGQERGFFMKHKEIIIMVTEDQKWLYIEASARKTKPKLPLLHLKIWQMTLEELLEKTLVLCSYKYINAIAIWDTLYGVLLREYDIKYGQLVALKRLRDLWTLYDHEVFERTPEYEHVGYDYKLHSACKREAYKDFYSK